MASGPVNVQLSLLCRMLCDAYNPQLSRSLGNSIALDQIREDVSAEPTLRTVHG